MKETTEKTTTMRVAKMKEGIFKPSMPDPMPSMLPSKASAPTGVIKKMFNKHQHIYSKVIIRYKKSRPVGLVLEF